jgi:CII-binding regulator of phage lambda lysogenization HflD
MSLLTPDTAHKTTLRAIETFFFVLVSSFIAQITVGGQAIDLSQPESQSRVLTALLAAGGIAFRQFTATK